MMSNYIAAFVLGIFALMCILFIIGSVAVTVTSIRGNELEYPTYSPIMGVSCVAIVATCSFLLWIMYGEIHSLISGVC